MSSGRFNGDSTGGGNRSSILKCISSGVVAVANLADRAAVAGVRDQQQAQQAQSLHNELSLVQLISNKFTVIKSCVY